MNEEKDREKFSSLSSIFKDREEKKREEKIYNEQQRDLEGGEK